MFDLVVRLTDQPSYYLVGDDPLLHKTGLKVYGAGMHRDACWYPPVKTRNASTRSTS